MTSTYNQQPAPASGRKFPAQAPAERPAPRKGPVAGGRSGLGRTQRSGGPVAPRSRSRGLIAVAVVLVLSASLIVGYLVSSAGDKTSVLVIGSPVAKGEAIERGDLVQSSVAGVNGAIPIEDIDQVVGETAAVDLVEGQILTDPMLTTDPVPGEGRAVVGLALEPNRAPSVGLGAGDVVSVIAVPAGDTGATGEELDTPLALTEGAEVLEVAGAGTAGGQVLLTLVVDEADASRIAAYSTANRVAVVETSTSAGE